MHNSYKRLEPESHTPIGQGRGEEVLGHRGGGKAKGRANEDEDQRGQREDRDGSIRGGWSTPRCLGQFAGCARAWHLPSGTSFTPGRADSSPKTPARRPQPVG